MNGVNFFTAWQWNMTTSVNRCTIQCNFQNHSRSCIKSFWKIYAMATAMLKVFNSFRKWHWVKLVAWKEKVPLGFSTKLTTISCESYHANSISAISYFFISSLSHAVAWSWMNKRWGWNEKLLCSFRSDEWYFYWCCLINQKIHLCQKCYQLFR